MVGPSVKAKLLGLTSSRSTSEALPVLEGADAFAQLSLQEKKRCPLDVHDLMNI